MRSVVKESTLLQIATKRVGVRSGFKAVTYMVAWQIVRDDLGHDPTVAQYADWWRESQATAYREQALFREAFPEERTPARLLDATAYVWANRPNRRPSPSALAGAVPA